MVESSGEGGNSFSGIKGFLTVDFGGFVGVFMSVSSSAPVGVFWEKIGVVNWKRWG